MKLLLLSEFFPGSESGDISGGVEARNFYLAKYLKEDRMIVLTSDNKKGETENRIFNKLVKTVGPRYDYSQDTSLFKRFCFAVACVLSTNFSFDLVEGTNFITHMAAITIGKIKKKKVVLWYPDVWIGEWVKNLGIKGVFGEIMERLVLFFGKNSKFIAISENTKNKLVKHGVPMKNIVVIPCGVDKEEINKIQKETHKEFDLIAVNRLVKYKNTEKIIRSITDNNKFLIIGAGPEKTKLKDLISKNNLNDQVEIISNIKNHADLLQKISSAKIFVSASNVEGYNITALEAASLGLPCLLSDIPVHREHQRNLEGCELFVDEKDLKNKISKMLENREIYEKYKKLNLDNSKKYYWKNIVDQTEKVYENYYSN